MTSTRLVGNSMASCPHPTHLFDMSSIKSNASGKSGGTQAASPGSRQRPKKPGRESDLRCDGRFVPYLPHEDAVAAGLREWKVGLDASVSQEVIDLLNAELSALLRLRPHQFWKHATTDESLQKYLESYLRFRRRWYDITPDNNGEAPVGTLLGDYDLYCHTFKVLYRMSSFHESRAASAESSQTKEPPRMLFEEGVLDISKLMDICAIYGHDNPVLTRRLVNNVLVSVPNVADEVSAIVLPLVHTVDTMHRRCLDALQEYSRAESNTVHVDNRSLHQQLVEVLDYLNDVVATISAFINAYPEAASILATFAAPSNVQGPFLPFLAGVHDSLLPLLRKGISATLCHPYESWIKQQRESHSLVDLRFKRLRIHLVSLTWDILKVAYLGNLGIGTSGPCTGSEKERPGGVQGDFVIQAIVSLAKGVEDKENFSFGSASGLLKLNCTSAMLKNIEKRYGLCEQIRLLCHSGDLILDDGQYEYLAALAFEQGDQVVKAMSYDPAQQWSGGSLMENADEPVNADIQSKVQHVRDIFPAFGTGFTLACLEVYDNDPESVIQNILEGTLYPDLACLETWLEKKPSPAIAALSRKGKGKKILLEEQPRVVSQTSGVGQLASSSSQVRPEQIGATSPSSEESRASKAEPAWGVLEKSVDCGIEAPVKRFEALNTNFAATPLEYDDEYDDSFDDLVTYPGDTGVEEFGSLDDVIAQSSGFDAGNPVGWRRQEESGIASPWSKKHGPEERRRSKSGSGQASPSTRDSSSGLDERGRPLTEADSWEVSGIDIRGNRPSADRGHQYEIGSRQSKYKSKEETPSGKGGVVAQMVEDGEVLASSLEENGVPVARVRAALGEGGRGDSRMYGVGRGGGYRRRREYIARASASSG